MVRGMEIAIDEGPAKRGRGAPAMPYCPETAERICLLIASGSKGLSKLLAETADLPSLTVVTKWLLSRDDFKAMYARAKEQQAELMGEDILDIADDTAEEAHSRRIKVDARKWLMSKLQPRKYGDKLDVTSGGEPLPPANSITIDQRVQSIMLLATQRREQEEEAKRLLE